jgi:antitoxin component YwqK of YwqJK toxin-antitoxin module
MKKALGLIIILFISSTVFSQNPIVIKLKTVTDSVKAYDKSGNLEEHFTYTSFYEFKNAKDSMYLALRVTCFIDGSFMMSELKCSPSYNFAPNIEDGIYTIVVDGKLREKISFSNGKRNGLTCRYNKRPYDHYNPSLDFFKDEKLFFVQNYFNNDITEYYALDKKGNVVEYIPVIKDSSGNSYELAYYFDSERRLRSIDYVLNSIHYRTDFFSKIGKYEKKKNNKKPDGWTEILIGGTTFGLNFKNGIVLNWEVIKESSSEIIGLDVSSDKIGIKRTDILEFIEL